MKTKVKSALPLVAIIMLAASCNSASDKEDEFSQETEVPFAEQHEPTDADSLPDLIAISDKMDLLSLERVETSPVPAGYEGMCNEWELDEEIIKNIFRYSRPITPGEWHNLFSHLPCDYHVELQYEEKTAAVTINSGGWLTTDMALADSLFGFGCFDQECEAWFHDIAWDLEEME